jgi:hypothetical protein
MSYYIDIINTTSSLTQVVVENASASGIVLKWNGGDTKDGMSIVTSEFNFDMLSTTADDAAFIGFFTGDEHKYKVLVKNSVDDAVVWTGYVLPDLYSEPYKNGCFFVSFTASDGLGRLKGKYLPDEYYSREKSLIDIYCQILKLTGIELDLYFLPAIENFVNKDWNTIFINTENFIDGKKKKDAYAILETLLEDTLCVCYQCDNRWNIEGINQRNVRNVTYKVYDVDGVFVENVTYNRLLKNITPLQTPIITIVPPYNEITVTYKKIAPSLPKTISKEVNDGWAITTGVKGEIYPSSWMANGDYYAKCKTPDYYCTFYNLAYIAGLASSTEDVQDDSAYISLREKIFIAAGQKIKFAFKFIIKRPGVTTANPSNMLLWKNPFKYEIIFNGDVIYSNFSAIPAEISDVENVIFNDSAEAEIAIEHIFIQEGLLDILFYAPPGIMDDHKIEGIIINSAAVDVISFQEEEIITDLISGDFTIDKEIELTFADDKSGVSEGFRLAKLKEQTSFFNELEIPILYSFPTNAKLLVVQLEGANLIKENLYSVYIDDVLTTVLNVYYNYNNGEQMVVELEDDYVSGVLTVKKYAVDDVVASRNHWIQWTDAIYKIENSSYGQVVANIYRRIFNQAIEKIDLTSLDAVKFNDIILFRYVYEKDFFVLNTSWNLDENKSTLTLGRSHYKDASSTAPGDDNIPPIVLAGSDIYIEDAITTASLLATAFDPDGYIASQVWTKTVGGAGDVITTPSALATTLTNLTEDFYTYQIQVTDSNSATAVDTVNVIRLKDYIVSLELISQTDDSADLAYSNIVSRYQLTVTPNIPAEFTLTFTGIIKAVISVLGLGNGYYGNLEYKIEKNGVIIESADVISTTSNTSITLNYQAADDIFIDITTTAVRGTANAGDYANVYGAIIINTAIITNGVGTILGLPVEEGQTVSVISE